MTGRRAAVLMLLALIGRPACAAQGVVEPETYRMDDYRAPTPETVPGGSVVHTAALRELVGGGGVLLVDVLPATRRPDGMKPGTPWMPLPRMDLPGSVWLPDVGRGALSAEMETWFREQLAQLSGGDPTRVIVFYCLADCWMSWNATKRAAGYGYRHVLWYPEGTDGWQAEGGPLSEARPRTPPE